MTNIIAFKGQAGSGKSTLAKLCTALLCNNAVQPFANILSINDIDVILDDDKSVQYIITKNNVASIVYDRFANPLKMFFASLLGCDMQKLNSTDFKQQKFDDIFGNATLRQMHIAVSDFIKQYCDNDTIFANSMKRRLSNILQTKPSFVIIDDLRYIAEAETLKELVSVNAKLSIIECKSASTINCAMQHSSETEQLQIKPDYVIHNKFDLQDNANTIVNILNNIVSKSK